MTNSENKILEKLNPQQLEAVTYTDGPLLILAGAGSGKTRVLTHKIAYLHTKFDVPLHNILAVTFTNKAAKEMVARVENLVGVSLENKQNRWVLTFHALANKILQRHADRLGYDKGFVVYDSNDQQSLIKKIMSDLDIDNKNTKPNAVLGAISEAKNKLISPEKYEQGSFFREVVSKVYVEYQKQLVRNNAMDFDDLLLNLLALLRDNEDILKKFQQQFQFVLVDEYQDINLPQYMVCYLLAAEHKRLFVVGDIDQNIYSWRGANLQNILNFEKDFPQAKVILLEQNYRSTSTILNISNQLIKHNKVRKEKNLWTENEVGEKAMLYIANNEYDEAEHVATNIQRLLSEKISPKEVAVLYRTNSMSRVLEQVLTQYNIKYRVYGGFRFYERKEIKDILAYLRLVQNEKDDVALMRIINVPSRKIGKITLQKLIDEAAEKNVHIIDVITEDSAHSLKIFKEVITDLTIAHREKNLPISKLIELIMQKTGYKEWLKTEDSQEAITRLENIEELIVATQESEYTLEEFLSLSALMSQQDEDVPEEETVTLMTFHSAKGLEFDFVFLCGFEENVLPHSQSVDIPEELEEERRLCYVGFTRARKRLFISVASHRTAFYADSRPHDISRFFYELPVENHISIQVSRKLNQFNHIITALREDYLPDIVMNAKVLNSNKNVDREVMDDKIFFDYCEGDVVKSAVFGEGVIVKTIGQGKGISLQIRFRNETKLILPKYGKLEKVR